MNVAQLGLARAIVPLIVSACTAIAHVVFGCGKHVRGIEKLRRSRACPAALSPFGLEYSRTICGSSE